MTAEMMNVWVADGSGGLAQGTVPIPSRGPGQTLVAVKASALQRGEVRYLGYFPKGRVMGLDLAGEVVEADTEGNGPPVGARVIAYGGSPGGWAEYATVPTATLAEIPAELDLTSAATLPAPGLTALYAIRHGGSLLGATVLVTGVNGAVGHFAAQLAIRAGAEVTGTVTSEARARQAQSLGLANVAIGTDWKGPFDLIVDTIGGGVLGTALEEIGPDGVVVTVGGGAGFDAPPEPAVVPLGWFGTHPDARLQAVNVGERVAQRTGVARDLRTLAVLATQGSLDTTIENVVGWDEVVQTIDAFKDGKLKGRVVVRVGDTG
jgi:NADPH:quinone reductase-like Zn-dependent oxidoreductase